MGVKTIFCILMEANPKLIEFLKNETSAFSYLLSYPPFLDSTQQNRFGNPIAEIDLEYLDLVFFWHDQGQHFFFE